ncbi:acyltransferase [Halobacteriales archaeon QH_8_64_26]|nr:MAG: acyltransferase [Halobacteriales archaeon QH_8_64_26]
MQLRSDPLSELRVPDSTTVEERDLVTDGDVFVGGQSTVDFGVRGRTVIAGERVRFGGDIEAEGDCRLDMWCDVAGNVLVGADAYFGERVHVGGQLMVSGDLDIGDDVSIEEGFEASGWIVIRNPMPTVVFLFVYLSQLLRLGEEEAAADVLEEVTEAEPDGEETIAGAGETGRDDGVGEGSEEGEGERTEPLVIPRGGRVSDDAWRVSTPAVVGNNCRLHGNLRAESIEAGEGNEIFGSLRAREDITIGSGSTIHGDVTTRKGSIAIAPGARVLGDVSCSDLDLGPDVTVDGAIRARGEVTIGRDDDPAPG